MLEPAGGPRSDGLGGVPWRTLVEGAAVLSAFVYATGWLFFALFFAEFDIAPETAGICFSLFLCERASFSLSARGSGASRVGRSVSVRTCIGSGEIRLRNGVFVLAFFAMQLLIVTVLVLFANAWRPWRFFDAPWSNVVAAVMVAASVIILGVEASLVLVWSKYRWRADDVVVARPTSLVVVAAVVVCVVVGSLVAGAPRLADRVREGEQFSIFGFRVDRVRVAWADSSVPRRLGLEGQACATLLGSSNGESVLFFASIQRTVLVNSSLVVVSRDLSGTCSKAGSPD